MMTDTACERAEHRRDYRGTQTEHWRVSYVRERQRDRQRERERERAQLVVDGNVR